MYLVHFFIWLHCALRGTNGKRFIFFSWPDLWGCGAKFGIMSYDVGVDMSFATLVGQSGRIRSSHAAVSYGMNATLSTLSSFSTLMMMKMLTSLLSMTKVMLRMDFLVNYMIFHGWTQQIMQTTYHLSWCNFLMMKMTWLKIFFKDLHPSNTTRPSFADTLQEGIVL